MNEFIEFDPGFCDCLTPEGMPSIVCETGACYGTQLIIAGEPIRQLAKQTRAPGFVVSGFPALGGPVSQVVRFGDQDVAEQFFYWVGCMTNFSYRLKYAIDPDSEARINVWVTYFDPKGQREGWFSVSFPDTTAPSRFARFIDLPSNLWESSEE